MLEDPNRVSPATGAEHGNRLSDQVERLAHLLERSNVIDYLALTQRPGRLFWLNFWAGTARGVGMVFGVAVVSALLLSLLKSAVARNLPYFGELIADLLRLIDLHRF